jgi:spore germination cell wall hydrolase CwlJ-like protein
MNLAIDAMEHNSAAPTPDQQPQEPRRSSMTTAPESPTAAEQQCLARDGTRPAQGPVLG